ncbi:rasGAP-activating-like protein 1 isoform X9 [Anas acuta]|uniref:rasGAP-activating-like protein 1 isoform X9 n=1 Tax=Anas acuta TaxID=28680 RepID=UPI0035C89AD1
MAKSTSLRCRVLEGKDLPAKDVSGSSDPYCVVKVDNEVVARTATVWKSLNPFWGEEYTLRLPRGFRSLAIYVLDEDTIGHDDVIGKVSLSHQQISAQPRGIDSWLSLAPVDPDEEVQGEIQLEVQVPEQGHPRVLRCHLIGARDLAPRDPSGTSDPFARVSCCGHTQETAVIKKTRFPRWDEVLEFELAEGELGDTVLSVEVWDWDMVGKNDFLGRVRVSGGTGGTGATVCAPPFGSAFLPKTQVELPVGTPGATKGWFQLLPFTSSTEEPGGRLGSLRVAVRLVEEQVLPPRCYQPLIQLLAEPIRCPGQPPAGTALAVLEEVSSGESRQDVATKLVKIFLAQGLAVPFLDYLIARELARTTDPNTLFRSNSLASKSVEMFMKVVGLPYLHEVLKPVVNRVFEEKKYVELDPCKMELSRGRRISFKGSLSEAQVRESSLGLLQGYLGDTVDAIVGSVEKCPPLMRAAFKQLRRRVEEQFPSEQHEEVRYFSISGFLFLRFFAPAVLTPKLFGLREQHADPRTGRTLLLLAKALQSIGNLGLQLGKEPWMAPLHAVLLPSITRVKAFLDSLVEVDGTHAGEELVLAAPLCPTATIKEGFLHVREAEEPSSLLPRSAFKKRVPRRVAASPCRRCGRWSAWTRAPSRSPTSCRWWHRTAPGSSAPPTSSARVRRSCGSGCGRCGRPAAPTRPCCPLATPAPSVPPAGPAACSLPAPHPAAAGPTVPWLWTSGATPWTPRRRRRASTGTSGQRGHGCGRQQRGGKRAARRWSPPRRGREEEPRGGGCRRCCGTWTSPTRLLLAATAPRDRPRTRTRTRTRTRPHRQPLEGWRHRGAGWDYSPQHALRRRGPAGPALRRKACWEL